MITFREFLLNEANKDPKHLRAASKRLRKRIVKANADNPKINILQYVTTVHKRQNTSK